MGVEKFAKEDGRVDSMQLKSRHQSISLAMALALMAILGLACDTVIEYRPRDWSKVDERKFGKTIGLIDITITEVGGMIAHKSLLPEIAINNRGDQPAVIDRAILKANGSEYMAVPFGENAWVTVPPGEMRRINVDWELGKPLGDALKDPVEINLTIKVGNRLTEVTIPMAKA